MNPVLFNREDELPSSGSATPRGASETNVTKGQNTVKVRPFFIVALTVGLCFVGTELVATDCRSAFEDLKAKIRRTKTIACAEEEYDKKISAAKRKYEEALGRAAELRQADEEHRKAERLVNAEGDDREASADAAGIHRILVEEAAASYRQAQEDARKKRDETIQRYRKQGVFTYGAGVAAVFPSGERRVVDARLDADQNVLPLAYAQEQLRPVMVATYFPRDLTWGTGNRRWGFGPMLLFGEKGPWENLGLGAMIGVSRSGDTEGPLSFGLGIAYYMDNKARTLRNDFRAYETARGDGNGDHPAPVFVETTGHFVAAVVTVSIWDRPGKK